MANDRTEITTTRVGPAYLQEYAQPGADTSMQKMQEYRVIPRIKVIQAQMKNREVRDRFGVGAVILSPVNQLISEPKNKFAFVPAAFWPEFISWNDRKDKTLKAIHDRSFDPAGKIALLARDPKTRREEYGVTEKGEKLERRHTEVLTFPGIIYGAHPLAGTPAVLTFSKGEFFTGKNFISAAMLRRIGDGTAPLWAQVWEFATGERTRNEDSWWGIDFFQPSMSEPFIKEEEVKRMRDLHQEMMDGYKKQTILTDMSDADEDNEVLDVTELKDLE